MRCGFCFELHFAVLSLDQIQKLRVFRGLKNEMGYQLLWNCWYTCRIRESPSWMMHYG